MTKIYLAGGMKDNWQDDVMAAIGDRAEFIDPRTNGITSEAEYTAWDLMGVQESDIIFAYMNDANPSGYGMMLEIGYAKAHGKIIIYTQEGLYERGKYFGMARAAAEQTFDSLPNGISALKLIIELV